MSATRPGPQRPGTAGATRVCPHCKTTILESSSVCPACKHHLRFDPEVVKRAALATSALRVEGTIRHPSDGEAWEYSMVLTIKNDRGEEIDRKIVGVGAMRPGEGRTFSLSVEVTGDGVGNASSSRKH
ncbi:MAG TPA: hypothetical protein VKB52_11900 [Rhodanobacteraceae bacterium]|nr:hypothetical protein [Rhodanobacteraceae bacterium]